MSSMEFRGLTIVILNWGDIQERDFDLSGRVAPKGDQREGRLETVETTWVWSSRGRLWQTLPHIYPSSDMSNSKSFAPRVLS